MKLLRTNSKPKDFKDEEVFDEKEEEAIWKKMSMSLEVLGISLKRHQNHILHDHDHNHEKEHTSSKEGSKSVSSETNKSESSVALSPRV